MPSKSLEQRLYEALRTGRGITLSEDDVWNLVVQDNAMTCRLNNRAASEAGIEQDGDGTLPFGDWPTWKKYVKSMKNREGESDAD